jgi:hypothetical protein
MGTDPKPAERKQRGISSFFKPTGDAGAACNPSKDAAKENKRTTAAGGRKETGNAEVCTLCTSTDPSGNAWLGSRHAAALPAPLLPSLALI